MMRTGVVILAVALAGCATVSDFTEQNQKANVAVEQSSNAMLLLNVIRSYQRRPMHFTAIQSVKTPLADGTPEFALGLPAFGYDRAGKRTWTPSLTYKVHVPNFDVTVWDGQEFMRGITTPVDQKTFVYYLDQGWPLPLIVHLMVREIRLLKDGKPVNRYVNYPGEPEQFAAFQWAANTLRFCDIGTGPGDPDRYGPRLDARMSGDLQGLAKLKEQGLLLVPPVKPPPTPGAPAPDRTKEEPESAYFRVAKDGGSVLRFAQSRRPDTLPRQTQEEAKCTPLENAALMPLLVGQDDKAAKAPGDVIQFHMRSPEAVIYYLGELVRAEYGDPLRPERGPSGAAKIQLGSTKTSEQNLFHVRRGTIPEGVVPAAQVKYEDTVYWIPPDSTGGRSMHVLSLVQLLVNSQKNAKDLPATTTIRLQTQ